MARLTPTEQLELFVLRIDHLVETRLAKGGISFTFKLNYEWYKGLEVGSETPDNDDLRSFLLAFRHFISDKEPVFLYTIFNLCYRYLTSDELVEELAKARARWKTIAESGDLKLNINHRIVPPHELLDLWINGWYFHSDLEKLRRIQQMHPLEYHLSYSFFLEAMMQATQILYFVGGVVRHALAEGLVSDAEVRKGKLSRQELRPVTGQEAATVTMDG